MIRRNIYALKSPVICPPPHGVRCFFRNPVLSVQDVCCLYVIFCTGHCGRYDFGLSEHDEEGQHGISFETPIHRFGRHVRHRHQGSDTVSAASEARKRIVYR